MLDRGNPFCRRAAENRAEIRRPDMGRNGAVLDRLAVIEAAVENDTRARFGRLEGDGDRSSRMHADSRHRYGGLNGGLETEESDSHSFFAFFTHPARNENRAGILASVDAERFTGIFLVIYIRRPRRHSKSLFVSECYVSNTWKRQRFPALPETAQKARIAWIRAFSSVAREEQSQLCWRRRKAGISSWSSSWWEAACGAARPWSSSWPRRGA